MECKGETTDLTHPKEDVRYNAFHSQKKAVVFQSLSSNTVPTSGNSHFPSKPHPACPHVALYLSLRNKRNILPLQQNPSQLPSLALLCMYFHSIINHQIHKLVKALHPLAAVQQKKQGRRTYSNFALDARVDL